MISFNLIELFTSKKELGKDMEIIPNFDLHFIKS